MDLYSNLLSQLLTKETESIEASDYFLTLYYPSATGDSRIIQAELKSILVKAMRDNKDIGASTNLHNKIVEAINRKIDAIDDYKNGIAAFLKFNTEEKNKFENIREENLFVVPLSRLPAQEIFIDKTFDLDQLIWVNSMVPQSLVINLTPDYADFYDLNDDQLICLRREENQFTSEKERGFTQSTDQIAKSTKNLNWTRTDKIQRDNMEKTRGLLNQVFNLIKNNFKTKPKFDYLAIIYSNSITDLIDNFVNHLQKVFSNSKTIILINKSIENENELKEEIRKKIQIKQKQINKNLFKKAKEDDFGNYVEGWEKVAEASTLKKIETLFIKAKASVEGYIVQNGTISIKPINEANFVNNIAPWIINNVIKSSGKVVVFKRDYKYIPDIAAQIRY